MFKDKNIEENGCVNSLDRFCPWSSQLKRHFTPNENVFPLIFTAVNQSRLFLIYIAAFWRKQLSSLEYDQTRWHWL